MFSGGSMKNIRLTAKIAVFALCIALAILAFSACGKTQNTLTVKFNTAGGNMIESVIVSEGDHINAPAAPTKDGYIFLGWALLDGTPWNCRLGMQSRI